MYFWRYHSHRCRKLRHFTLRLTISGSKLRLSKLSNSGRGRIHSRGKAVRVYSRAMSEHIPPLGTLETECASSTERTFSTDPISSPLGNLDIEQNSSTEPKHVKNQSSDKAADDFSPQYPNKLAKNGFADGEPDQSNSGDRIGRNPIKSNTRQLSKDDSTDPDPYNLRSRFISKQVSASLHTHCTQHALLRVMRRRRHAAAPRRRGSSPSPSRKSSADASRAAGCGAETASLALSRS
jgi:hypothetical protein